MNGHQGYLPSFVLIKNTEMNNVHILFHIANVVYQIQGFSGGPVVRTPSLLKNYSEPDFLV